MATDNRQLIVDDLSLLAQITRICPDNPDQIHNRLSQKKNWPCFVKLAQDCGVPSLLYRQIKSNGWDSVVPEPVMQFLKDEYIQVHGTNMAYYHELLEIISEFREEGIHAAVLKGAANARYLYEDIGLRSFGDVDILVSEEEFPRADHLLRGRLNLSKSIPSDDLSRRCSFHYLYTSRKSPKLQFELHWKIFPDDSGIDYPQEVILDETVSMEVEGVGVPIPSAANLFIHLCIHFTGHSFSSLRDLWDMAWMIEKDKVPWNRLERLSSGSVRNRIYYSLFMVQSVFDLDLTKPLARFCPPPMVRRLFPKTLDNRGLILRVADRQKDLRAYIAWLMLPNWRARLKFMLSLMVPGICWLTIYPDNENPSPFWHRNMIFLRGVRLIGYLVTQMAANFSLKNKHGIGIK
jgi:hypothetical protein